MKIHNNKNTDNPCRNCRFVCSILCLLFYIVFTSPIFGQNNTKELAKGWNTWNTRSVLSHVLLPECFAINLQIKDEFSGQILEEALIGRKNWHGEDVEKIIPGPHSYDGSYTSLEIEWSGIKAKIQSATINDELVILVTPLKTVPRATLLIQPQMLWGKKGEIIEEESSYLVKTGSHINSVFISGIKMPNLNYPDKMAFSLNEKIAISTGISKDRKEVEKIIYNAEAIYNIENNKYNDMSDAYSALQRVLAWDIIYEPILGRVITPVSRLWNIDWGGWVLFEWDTYFAAYMHSIDNKELAYSNSIAITKEITANGFVPNFASGIGKSIDRSQPPIGSLMIKEIYKKYREKWFLEEVFDELLMWNRWWDSKRQYKGYLCFGTSSDTSTKSITTLYTDIEVQVAGKRDSCGMGILNWEKDKLQQSRDEAGLDNSPMYDNLSFDTIHHIMLLADVGLMSLYIADCKALAEIAAELDKSDIIKELNKRAEVYTKSLQTLWSDDFGMFLNKNLKTNEPSYRLSPTLFYPLLAKVATQKQAERMINEHFYNSKEFYGEYIIPSIARNDKSFQEQFYWRGRIWAPMNFLVYLGLRNYNLEKACAELAEKSKTLILKSWLEEGAVYENYNGITGQGNDVLTSDKFYHWGALLSCILLIEKGYLAAPEVPINSNK